MNECPYLAIITEHQNQRTVVRLQGELDVSTRDRLRHAISSGLEGHPPIFVVDLSELEFADCAGISILVWAQKRLAADESELVVTGAKPIVRRLLQLTGLDTYLHLGTWSPQSDPLPAKHSQVVQYCLWPGMHWFERLRM